MDGGNKGTNGSSRTPVGINTTWLGRFIDSSPQRWSGRIAEAAIWNVALSDAEVASLAKGYSPLFIQPTALVAYWPLIGHATTEIDSVGGFGLTVTGATKAAHPRIIYPSRSRLILPQAAAPAAGNRRRRVLIAGAA